MVENIRNQGVRPQHVVKPSVSHTSGAESSSPLGFNGLGKAQSGIPVDISFGFEKLASQPQSTAELVSQVYTQLQNPDPKTLETMNRIGGFLTKFEKASDKAAFQEIGNAKVSKNPFFQLFVEETLSRHQREEAEV